MHTEYQSMRLSLTFVFAFQAIAQIFDPNRPEIHENISEQFKYGSIGAEERAGIPYWIWLVLPDVFPKYLPDRPGTAYEKFGLIHENGRPRYIGISYRERQVPLVGLNCAVCHCGTVRDAPDQPRRVIPGMPSHRFDLQAYQRFFFSCVRDPEFTPERILNAIEKANPKLGLFEKLIYKFIVIPRTRDQGRELARSFSWTYSRPPTGPGRVDTFNPYKVSFGFNMDSDQTVGTADLPPLFEQRIRDGLWLHWDGNNDLVTERNKSAAIGAGASEDSLDLPAMKRVEDWIWTHKPPAFPANWIDSEAAKQGKALWEKHCAECHAIGGKYTGQVEPIEKIGTDPGRLDSFTAELTAKMNTIGTNKPWKFSHFRKTNGYANMPLDGIWLRAPYLHNGSVPTLRDLLNPPAKRPAVFWRGYDVYDYKNVGFVTSGAGAEREGFKFEVFRRGNGNGGHVYGTKLTDSEKLSLIEHMKTL
jgi:hypothetical protein